ncbi:MAG: response regulator transcription factor [Clostridia bacterium]|nr:response regulator transcription factor [Clostridia bacterium]
MKKILVIEDDIYIGNMVEEALRKNGYCVSRAYSGTEALLVLKSSVPDLILLDLMLPGLSGEALLPKIKSIPVIVVSAKTDITGKVELLSGGAVDYITKPFDIRELLARIEVQLRNPSTKNAVIVYKELVMDTAAHSVVVANTEIKLTKTEYAILKQLMLNPSQIITKSQFLDLISIDTPDCTDSSLKVHISNLRKKLSDVSGEDYIESVWGIGFKMK